MRRGINMEVKDYDGATPLELAEEHNHEDCIVLLRAAREQKKNAPKVFSSNYSSRSVASTTKI